MAATQQVQDFMPTPELGMYDSEDAYSSGEEELPSRKEIDDLLRRAHHYVITEGGKDSSSTYMERIHYINRNIVQEISTYNYDCDRTLYRRVKQKVDHVLREFEDYEGVDSRIDDYVEVSRPGKGAVKKSLSRGDSSPRTPTSPPARHALKVESKKEDIERTYQYGGPDNYPEIWYQKAPASLPFPETIRIAEYESLRIHWDLATTGNLENKEPVTSNAVKFNDRRLARFDNLGQYDSGSRFTTPYIDSKCMASVTKYGTFNQLANVVEKFNKQDDLTKAAKDYKYAPRILLEQFAVVNPGGKVIEPNVEYALRKAVNESPVTKPRQSSSASTAKKPAAPLSKRQSVSPAVRRIKEATEASIRSSPLPQSPPLATETKKTQTTTPVSIPAKRRGRPRKDTSPIEAPPAASPATGKRKRDAEPLAIANNVPAKRRAAAGGANPYTPTTASHPGLHVPSSTPATTPALTMSGSSAASTPAAAKAKNAGKKTRKSRSKRVLEERVSPEKYEEIMASRRSIVAEGHEEITRGSTRSGRVRRL
ncbi:hypothetical protein E8E13_008443 [Curvularia kusanoi]|uniref:Uncharacterized protein n=1 Tax=Curvularia kusanoi TaxID=90978 RepID=A0A9P4WCZ1_CURKU|nr:hypothetical protein E8E13_008443 [Curvularia kusanoi]